VARHAALALSFIPAFAERIGTLVATGLIVGESLMGVLFAGVVARTERAGAENSGEVLALVEHFAWAVPLGLVLFFGSTAWLHGWTRGQAKDAPLNEAPMADVGGAVRSAGGFVSHQASAHCRGAGVTYIRKRSSSIVRYCWRMTRNTPVGNVATACSAGRTPTDTSPSSSPLGTAWSVSSQLCQ